MEQKIEKMNSWFEKQIAACGIREKELQEDDRKDEAVFEKVRANIYDVFRTWLNIAVRISKGNEEEVKRFFAERSKQLPDSWTAAYEKAKEHNDAARMQTEQVKLDAAREIMAKYAEIWEGAE